MLVLYLVINGWMKMLDSKFGSATMGFLVLVNGIVFSSVDHYNWLIVRFDIEFDSTGHQ